MRTQKEQWYDELPKEMRAEILTWMLDENITYTETAALYGKNCKQISRLAKKLCLPPRRVEKARAAAGDGRGVAPVPKPGGRAQAARVHRLLREERAGMSYIADTERCIATLEEVGSAAYASAPRKGVGFLYKDEEKQFVEFGTDALAGMRTYLAKYGAVLARVRYRQPSFFGESGLSASLLEMIGCMMSEKDGSPEYVLANAERLRKALTTHAEEFKARQFALEMAAAMRTDPR